MMPSEVVSGISSPFGELSQSLGQVAHVLLTRSPLIRQKQASAFTVRLACVKHAASVRPEPGSNSPLMLFKAIGEEPMLANRQELIMLDRFVVFTKGISVQEQAPTTGFFGIDLWHAVEFSRSRRAPSRPFGPSRGNSPNLPTWH
jgi:hypothetical protein